jgi:hypothetical protein
MTSANAIAVELPHSEQASSLSAEPERSALVYPIDDTEQLIAALDNSSKLERARAEIDRRLSQTPKANRFAYRFALMWSRERTRLLSPHEAVDLKDALDGLRRCCFKAIGTQLWAPCYRGDDKSETTLRFVEDRIIALLEPCAQFPESELLILALREKFKNIPAAIRCDLLDRIRKEYTKKAKVLTFLTITKDQAAPRIPNSESVVDHLTLNHDELSQLLTPDGYQTLLIATHFGQSDEGNDSKQERRGGLTKAISEKQGVKLRRATDLKKQLHTTMRQALKDGNPVVSGLFKSLRVSPETAISSSTPPAQDMYSQVDDDSEASTLNAEVEDSTELDSEDGPDELVTAVFEEKRE